MRLDGLTLEQEEFDYRASRVQSALMIVALGFLLYITLYCFVPRPRVQLVLCVAALGLLVARAWARRPPRGRWESLPVHLAIVSAAAAVPGTALFLGGSSSASQYYLVLIPAFAACLLPVRATFCWALVAIAGFGFLPALEVWFPVEDAPAMPPAEVFLSQATLVLLVFGAAYSQWRTTAQHVDAIHAREHTITEQAHQLELARDAALRASQVKSQFLATVSHEIRTPLNAVIGLTELVLESKLDEEQRGMLETVHRSGDSLLSMLNDVLDFSKIESDRIELEQRAFSLRACIDDGMEMLAARATEQGVELLCDYPMGIRDWILGDPMRVRQVVVNLLSNAIKFTHDGEVVVTVREDEGDRLRIAVRDTGIGIPPDRRDRLFQPFSQIDASTTRRYGGTGLGLAISCRLVERMGGAMTVESEPGRGSEFTFTLPAPAAAAQPGELRFDPAPLFGRRLLVVHPHPAQRDLLERDGADRGLALHSCATLGEAVALLRSGERFDAAVVDARVLGETDADRGTEAVFHDLLHVPAVLLTAPGEGAREGDGSDVARLGTRFRARLARPVRTKRLAETLVRVWATCAGAAAEGTGDARRTGVGADAGEPRLAERLPLRILVAEDNLVNQRVVMAMLERLGYRADVVADGCEAVAAATARRYDLVLMDVQMPEMDGIEATRAIRALGAGPGDARIVALTANAMSEDRVRCLEAGMDEFLTKPISARDLRAAIERCGDGGLA